MGWNPPSSNLRRKRTSFLSWTATATVCWHLRSWWPCRRRERSSKSRGPRFVWVTPPRAPEKCLEDIRLSYWEGSIFRGELLNFGGLMQGMKSYPFVQWLFHKPWNKDSGINQRVFHGSCHWWVLITLRSCCFNLIWWCLRRKFIAIPWWVVSYMKQLWSLLHQLRKE